MASQGWNLSELLETKGVIAVIVGVVVALFAAPFGFLNDQTNLDVVMSEHPNGGTLIAVENVSITKAAEHHVFTVLCKHGNECMPKYPEKSMPSIAAVKAFLPAIQRFNQPCDPDDSNLSFSLSLPPGGKVEVWIAPEPTDLEFRLSGKAATPPCDQLRNVDTILLLQASPVHYVKASVLRTIRTSLDIFLPALVAIAAMTALAMLFIARLFRRKRRVARKR
jgi:hypothetical protein